MQSSNLREDAGGGVVPLTRGNESKSRAWGGEPCVGCGGSGVVAKAAERAAMALISVGPVAPKIDGKTRPTWLRRARLLRLKTRRTEVRRERRRHKKKKTENKKKKKTKIADKEDEMRDGGVAGAPEPTAAVMASEAFRLESTARAPAQPPAADTPKAPAAVDCVRVDK
jgi:hypothetical protein